MLKKSPRRRKEREACSFLPLRHAVERFTLTILILIKVMILLDCFRDFRAFAVSF
jgi:hypothetical protein